MSAGLKNKIYIKKLICELWKKNAQRSIDRYPQDFFRVMQQYWPLSLYMLKKFGWKSWYSFWYTKLFVVDEGGEYDFMHRVYSKFPVLLKKPFKLEIEHTTVCNKKCIFCAHTHFGEKQFQMSFGNFKFIVDSTPNIKWVNMAGIGSAFLNHDFIKMIAYAREKHINVNFVDEFDSFNKDQAIIAINLGINSIYVSFDAATKQTYEKIKSGCSFDKALNNIITLLKLKEEMHSPFPILHFRFIITTINYHEMPDYVKLIASLKNRGVRARVEFIGLISFPGIEKYFMPINNIPEEIMIKVYENALKNNINLYFSHAGGCLPLMKNCVRWAEPFVLVNGGVIPCCSVLMQNKRKELDDISIQNNAFEVPFQKLWNSNRYKALRKMIVTSHGKVPKSCLKCISYDTNDRIEKYGIWDYNAEKTERSL